MEKNYKEALKLDNQLCFPLYASARKIMNAYTPYLKPYNLTYTQYLVFLVLFEEKKISVKELGERLYLDSGTLTPMLKNMEKEGYVVRSRSKKDERITIVNLSQKGEDMYENLKNIPFKVGEALNLKVDDTIELRRLLNIYLGK